MMMKRFITIILAMLTLTGVVAQNNKSWRQNQKPMSATETTAYLTKELGLTDKQKQKVEKLHEEYADLFKTPQRRGNAPGKNGNQPQQKHNNPPRESRRTAGQAGQGTQQRAPRERKPNEEREKQMKSYQKGLKKILTSKQYKSYEQLMSQRKK